jgi:hypothetical protein
MFLPQRPNAALLGKPIQLAEQHHRQRHAPLRALSPSRRPHLAGQADAPDPGQPAGTMRQAENTIGIGARWPSFRA